MADLENICYKRSFLAQVIIRIDFLQIVPNEIIFQEDIEKAIKKYFPISGKYQVVKINTINVSFNSKNAKADATGSMQEGLQREYFDNDGQNRIILSNQVIIFEINKYTRFADHLIGIKEILYSVVLNAKISTRRTGVRYINLFPSKDITIRKNFFKPEIAACLSLKPEHEDGIVLTRSMHLSEYHIGDLIMNFRYGMFNPEYPGKLRLNDFSLDYDCSTEDLFTSSEEIMNCIIKGHDAIQKMYENSILDALRKIMNEPV